MLSFKQFLNELYIDLKHSDLTKRGGARTQVFVQKVKDGEPFLTKKGAVVLDRGHLDDIEKGMEKRGYRDIFTGTDTKNKRPVRVNYSKEFLKTPEFGGKGAGAGTAAEDAYLKNFTKLLETSNQSCLDVVQFDQGDIERHAAVKAVLQVYGDE